MPLARPLVRPLARASLARAVLGSEAQTIFAGVGTGMKFTAGSNSGGTNRSTVTRIPCISKIPIRRLKPLIPVFTCVGSNPIVDTLYSGSQAQLFFQGGIEYPFTGAVTGLSARIPFTFKGLNYAAYDNATWDASSGFIEGDLIDLGFTIPANTPFGITFTRELPAGSWNNNLPYQYNVSNFIQRFIGATSSTSSQIAALGGASDVALAATSFTSVTTAQSGASTGFGPAALLVESPLGTKTVVIAADSLGDGVGEGTDTADLTGDCLGNAQMVNGYFARGVFAAGLNYVNISKGSDGNKFLITPDNWKYRRELIRRLRPTHVINGNGHNDVTASITVSAKVNGNTYGVGDAVLGTGLYVCVQGGVSSTVSLTSTTVGTLITDGAVVWLALGTLPGTSNPRGWSTCFGQELNVNRQIAVAAPSAKIITAKVTPDAASTFSITGLASVTTLATATVASTTGLTTGDTVLIAGASPAAYNGAYVITVVNATTFTYVFAGGTSPATGTITGNTLWAKPDFQTPATGFGDGTTRRGFLNAAKDDPVLLAHLGASKVINVNTVLEDTVNSSKWKGGSIRRYTGDGTHPNTNGAVDGSAVITAPVFTP